MITVAMSSVVRAERDRVWRALVEPEAIARWTPHVVGPADAPPGYPRAGQHVRWPCRFGRIPLVLHDRPERVIEGELLQRRHALGPLRLLEIFRLEDAAGPAPGTHLHLKVTAPSRVPLVGGLLDRFAVRSLLAARVNDSLAGIRALCELGPERPAHRRRPAPRPRAC